MHPNASVALAQPREMNRRILSVMVMAVAIVLAYGNSFSAPFVLDDAASIAENPTIRQLWPLGSVLSPPPNAGVGGRPLANFSFALSYALGGTHVTVYHAMNLAIHLGAALALFGLVRRTLALPQRDPSIDSFRCDLIAGGATLLWSLHPLHTEAVTYLSQRTESQMGLFFILTLYCFVRSTQGRRLLWQVLAVGACLFAMTTKEVALTAPAIVALFDRTFVAGSFREVWRQRRGFHGALLATWIVPLFLLSDVHERGVGYATVAWWEYALTETRAIMLYLKLAVWPSPLVFDYGTSIVHRPSEVWLQLGGVAVVVATALLTLRRAPVVGFFIAGFLILLAPTSSIVPVAGQPIAEHRMYLPLAPLAILAALGIARLRERWALVGFSALGVVLATATFARNRDYRSALALWQDTVAKTPDNPRALASLGAAHLEQGDLPKAVAFLTRSLELDPRSGEAHNNLATAWVDLGRTATAIEHFSRSIALRPGIASTHYNFGNALLALGRPGEAIDQQRRALELRRDFPEALCALGNAQFAAGRFSEAIASQREALRLRPDLIPAHYGAALALVQEGQNAAAIPHFETVLRAVPASLEAHFNFGNLLLAVGRLADALQHYEAALQLKPDFADAMNNAGNALALMGRRDEAIARYEAALRINPTNSSAHQNLRVLRQRGTPGSNTP
jgi:tetratricopeptide (TPR) repeat protein